jgi:superfamily I DNA/RNA helicase
MTDNRIRVLLGPPGTGKTTTLLDEIEDLLELKVSPKEIAFVSYTKAAIEEAKVRASSRFNIDPDEFEFFRTIHSMAFRSIGRQDVMTDANWKAFGESFRYDFTELGDEPTLNFAEDGDCLRSLNELRRVKRCSVEQAVLHAGDVPPHITVPMVELFASRLTSFKQDTKVIDFTDMLEKSLASPWRPPVLFAFIDETQDNSRLQNLLTEHWFWDNTRCEQVKYAGDDDQAIFGWSGGDRQALVRLSKRYLTTILHDSHRVPRVAHAFAESIIRENRMRVAKTYHPTDEPGELEVAEDPKEAMRSCGTDAFVLVRNVMFAAEFRKALMDMGRLFSAEIGTSAPLDHKHTLGAFRAVASWRDGANVMAADLRSLLDLIPSKLDDQTIVPHGMKKKAKENEDPVSIWRARQQFGLDIVVSSVLREGDPFGLAMKLPPEERRYLELVLARDPYLTGDKIITTTIHRSKGREKPCVVLSPDMARRTYRRWASGPTDGQEEERSVQYVAATRTKNKLVVMRPGTQQYFDHAAHLRAAHV